MPVHKFKTGDKVFLEGSLNLPSGPCIIIRQLPERDGEHEYQIKSDRKPHHRVVRESQLSATGATVGKSTSFGTALDLFGTAVNRNTTE